MAEPETVFPAEVIVQSHGKLSLNGWSVIDDNVETSWPSRDSRRAMSQGVELSSSKVVVISMSFLSFSAVSCESLSVHEWVPSIHNHQALNS